jgi:flagellum-specific peptidoglycan hydrolase FlgJ
LATILDALVVTFGLDASGLSKGASQVSAAQAKMQKDAEESSKTFKKQQEAAAIAFDEMQDKAVSSGKITAAEADKRSKEFVKRQSADASIFKKSQKEQSDIARKKSQEESKSAKEREQSSKKAAEGLSSIRNEILGIATAFLGAAGIKSFLENFVGINTEISRNAALLDISAEKLNAWQNIGAKFGASAGEVQGAFKAINQLQRGLQTGDAGSISSLTEYGQQLHSKGREANTGKLVSANTTSEEFMLEIAKENEGLSEKDIALNIKKLGLSENVAHFLKLGNVELAKQVAEMEKTSSHFGAASKLSESLSQSWAEFKVQVEDVGNAILVDILPPILSVLKVIKEFAKAHPDAFKDILIGIAGLITAITAALTLLVAAPFWGTIVSLIGLIMTAIELLSAASVSAIAALTTGFEAVAGAILLLSGPIGWTIAAIIAIVAAVVLVYNKWTWFHDAINSTAKSLWEGIKAGLAGLVSIAKSVFDSVMEIVSNFVMLFKDEFAFLKVLFTGTGAEIRAAWAKVWDDIWNIIVDTIGHLTSLVVDFGFAIWDAIIGAFVKVSAAIDKLEADFAAFLDALPQKAIDSFKSMLSSAKELFPKIKEAIISAFSEAFDYVIGRANAVWDAITGRDIQKKKQQETKSVIDQDKIFDETKPPTAQDKKSLVNKLNVPSEIQELANKGQEKYGVPASVTTAQWALESNNGKRMPAGSNNPFGIKARQGDPFVESITSEFINGKEQKLTQRFRKFDSLEESFDEHAKILAKGSAYKEARSHIDDPKAYAEALTGHYATDPKYGEKLKSIMARQSSENQNLDLAAQSTIDPAIAQALKPGPKIDRALQTGAAAAISNNATNNNQVSNSHQTETTINAPITIAGNNNPQSVAQAIGEKMKSFIFSSNANTGMTIA